ncbi:MAG: alpha/beta fold hydrolase [Myxococcota bacterium]
MKGARLAAALALAVLSCIVSGCHTPRASGKIQTNRPFTLETNGHVVMGQAVSLGETPQHLDISGRTDTQPVMLYLHGGPGRSALPSAHVYAASLERHFVVAHWDQRGTQRSFTDALEDFPLSLERLVNDTVELAGLLSNWFERERVVLVAEGVAALPALQAAERHPEAFYAVVLLAPIVDMQAALAHGYQWALGRAHDRQDVDGLMALQPLGKPPWSPELEPSAVKTLWTWLDRWGGTVPGVDAAELMRGIEANAPAARKLRMELAEQGEAYAMSQLWPALSRSALKRQMPTVNVPVFFIVGEADQRAPLADVQAYYEALDARQGKTLVKLDGVGHWPLLEAPERVLEVLAGRVWPMAQ